MTEAEFLGLKEDIREHGQREDIVVWQGQLIDGRHRLRACRELGIEPEIAELMDETDPWQYVVSHNLHRRHLTTAQRAMVADKLASRKQGEKKADTGIPVSPPSQAEAAAMLNVSVDSVQQARKIRKTATPETVAAVERGEITLNAAVATVKPEVKPATATAEPEVEKKSPTVLQIQRTLIKLGADKKRHQQLMQIANDALYRLTLQNRGMVICRQLLHMTPEEREMVYASVDHMMKKEKPATSGNQ
jgi:ParB-like chromosome segregation protein Spo0J